MLDKKAIQGHAPLAEYPWLNEVDRLFETSIGKDMKFYPFLFDQKHYSRNPTNWNVIKANEEHKIKKAPNYGLQFRTFVKTTIE